uniref:MULE transposase domain-containing protein n=1 Tax=Lactuca sativa TaxID=4236 RepID=A0A9R1V8G2_LACSA|nr:hypothetical protein LSAT_V11C600323620 [Lactuca sativa]
MKIICFKIEIFGSYFWDVTGVLPTIGKLFPCAENRFFLRHIHENMKQKWRGKEFKDYLWKCATTTIVQQVNLAMEELKKLNNDAYEWLKAIPPQHWSRSHFTGRAHYDAFLNNLCETLNSKLVKGRDKPIISCLEFIREYIMKKLVIVQKIINKCSGPLTPTATKTLEKIKGEAAEYRAVFCGNGKYQVTVGERVDQCVVDITQRTCSCNKWEVTGIIANIWDMMRNNENVGIPETWVHPTYWLKTLARDGPEQLDVHSVEMFGIMEGDARGRQWEDHRPVVVMWDKMLVVVMWDRMLSTNPQEDLIVRNTRHVCDVLLPRQLLPLRRRGT